MNLTKNRLGATPEHMWLIFIVAMGLAIRLAILAIYPHAPESDELAYLSMARNVISGHGVIDSAGNYALYNVGYPLFVVAPVLWVFGDSMTAVRIANGLLGVVAILLCHAVARQAGAGKLGRLLAALGLAFYLPTSLYTIYVFKENLMIPLMLGLLWCALRLLHSVRTTTVIGCGVLVGLLALTGNAGLALCFPLATALLLYSTERTRAVAVGWLALVALTAALIAAPWIVRNNHVLGSPVLNTNGGFNLYLGNNPNADGMYMSIADTPRGPTWSELRKSGEVQAAQTLKREAMSWIITHPSQFVRLAFRKLVLFWTPPLHDGKSTPSNIERLVRLAWAGEFFVLAVATIGAGLMPALRNRQCAILWLAIAAYSAVHMLFYVIFRYREPIMPVLCVLAAMSMEQLYHRFTLRQCSSSGGAGNRAT